MEREGYRTYHAQNKILKADHFFNFCVTANCLKDYYLEHIGKVTQDDKKPYYKTWAGNPLLVAVSEIANTSKHFVLRDRGTYVPSAVKTKRVTHKKSGFVDVFTDGKGNFEVQKVVKNDISVTLSDDTRYELYAFLHQVTEYWKSEIKMQGIKVVNRRSNLPVT